MSVYNVLLLHDKLRRDDGKLEYPLLYRLKSIAQSSTRRVYIILQHGTHIIILSPTSLHNGRNKFTINNNPVRLHILYFATLF